MSEARQMLAIIMDLPNAFFRRHAARFVSMEEMFRWTVLRRRGRFGRYVARRRIPGRLLEAIGVDRRELGNRDGGLFQLMRRGHRR